MEQLKAFVYRLYPTEEQKRQIEVNIDGSRFIYNKLLEIRDKAYKEEGKSISHFDSLKMIPSIKEEHPWLKECDSLALQAAGDALNDAYQAFFRRVKSGEVPPGYPKFHKKGNRGSYTTKRLSVSTSGRTGWVQLPKMEPMRFVNSRDIIGQVRRATVRKEPSGKYYISILAAVDVEMLPPAEKVCGISTGYRRIATFDDGTVVENPKFLHKSQEKLARAQRKLSRKKKGSKNYEKQRKKVAAINERIVNQRSDFLHKLTTDIVRNNQVICVQEFDVKGMMQEHHMARLNNDVGYNQMQQMLGYKSKWYGRSKVSVAQDFPSARTCSACGAKSETPIPSGVNWTCPNCGTVHDRYVNSAKNNLNEGLRMLETGETGKRKPKGGKKKAPEPSKPTVSADIGDVQTKEPTAKKRGRPRKDAARPVA